MSQVVKSPGLLSILILGSGNVIGTLISALALILFSRFMGPTEFGLFSAAFATMQILVRLADLGTNMATERAIARVHGQDNSLSDRLMRTAFWFKLLVTTLTLTITWIFSPWIAHSFLHLEDVQLIHLAIVTSIGTVFFEYSTIVFQSTQHFAAVARITIAQALGKLIFGLIFITQGMLNASSALLIYGILPGVGAFLGWNYRVLTSLSLPSTWKKDLHTILVVAKWTLIAALSATLADNVDTLLVQSLLSSYDTGIWSGAVRIATFANVIGWSVGSVLSVRVAKYKTREHLHAYLAKAWKLSLAIFVLIMLSLPLASLAIRLTIGSAYLSSTVPLQILLFSTAITGAITPYVALFYLFDKPQYYAVAGIIQTLVLIVGDLLTIPSYGLLGSAWSRVGVRLAIMVFTLIYARSAYVGYFRTHDRQK